MLFDIGRFLKVYRRLFLFVFELRGLEAVEDYGGRGRCGVLDRGAQIAWEKVLAEGISRGELVRWSMT